MDKHLYRSALAMACVALLGACSEKASLDASQQSGADPTMPKAQRFLVPPMQVPDFAGWQNGAMPTVAPGLKIEKIAGDLKHPRQLLTLPNGDVLVVESNGPGEEALTTPKQLIAGMVKNQSGKGVRAAIASRCCARVAATGNGRSTPSSRICTRRSVCSSSVTRSTWPTPVRS